MQLIQCTVDQHADAILDIFNEVILNSTVLYEYAPRSKESMAAWFAARQDGGFPLIGAADDEGRLLGFATFDTFRPRPGFKYTVEHSVYTTAAKGWAGRSWSGSSRRPGSGSTT